MAMRRDLGFAGLTIASEQGKVWQEVRRARPMRPIAGPASRSTAASAPSTWASIGLSRLDEERTLLGGRLGSLYGGGGSSSLFLDVEARRNLGIGWSATSWAVAAGPNSPAANSRPEPIRSTSRNLACSSASDRFGLRIAQPLRVESGGISLLLPTAYDYATATATSSCQQLSFTPSGREIDAELSYSTGCGARAGSAANLFARRQPGHVASADPDMGAAIRYSLGF